MTKLVLVSYDNGAGKELCYAPQNKVFWDEIVETEFGRGTVVDCLAIDSNDPVLALVKKAYTIRPVLAIINPIDYKEKENALPER